MESIEPSYSAQSVAMHLLLLTDHPVWGKLVSPEVKTITQDLLRYTSAPLMRWLTRPWFRKGFSRYLEWAMPGFSLHLALRKQWIAKQVRIAIEQQDVRQIVILGAGFDALAIRFHRIYPEISWLEVDEPHTLQTKGQAIQQLGMIGHNYLLLPVDLSNYELKDHLLCSTCYDPEQMTLFIAEGVLMYLKQPEVSDLLMTIRQTSRAGSQLIATALAPLANGRLAYQNAKWLFKWQPKWLGEPLQWGIAANDLANFLYRHRFRLQTICDSSQLAALFTDKQPTLPKGEYFFTTTF